MEESSRIERSWRGGGGAWVALLEGRIEAVGEDIDGEMVFETMVSEEQLVSLQL